MRSLILYNSYTRSLEEFRSIEPSSVRMYSCGPTVYSSAHVGNMRAYVFADTLKRALMWAGYQVTHVINVTDVGHLVGDSDEGDDKMEIAAARAHATVASIAAAYYAEFERDLAALNVISPSKWAWASHYVDEMIRFAIVLESAGHAYRLPSGLYLDTSVASSYGCLGELVPSSDGEHSRIGALGGKRNLDDFALWRTFGDADRRVMAWPSPWGRGAPGWHLECSVMSIGELGSHFDIHTGGIDHRALHHENEIAQSELYLDDDQEWVHWWCHNAFVVGSDGGKMSKSDGRISTMSDLATSGISAAAVRSWMLSAHYRSSLRLSAEGLNGQVRRVERLEAAGVLRDATLAVTYEQVADEVSSVAGRLILTEIDDAIRKDLDTARVLANYRSLVRAELPSGERESLIAAFGMLTGLRGASPDSGHFSSAVEGLLRRRNEARVARDYDTADLLRIELEKWGVVVRDGASK